MIMLEVWAIYLKIGEGLVVYTLFNRQPHKYRNRKTRKKRERLEHEEIGKRVVDLLGKQACGLSFSFCAYVLSLPRRRLLQVLKKVEEWQMEGQIPRCVLLLLANDLVSYRKKAYGPMVNDTYDKSILPTNYMKVFFHSKGIEMINLPRILHDRRATTCILTFFKCMEPLTVGYSTISSKVFNTSHPHMKIHTNSTLQS